MENIEKEEKKQFEDDELVEDVDPNDDAPVQVIYRCKKCGQILSKDAKDCWKCSSKEIEEVVEEDTKELKKVMLQAQIDKLQNEIKNVKRNNDILFVIVVAIAVALVFALVK